MIEATVVSAGAGVEIYAITYLSDGLKVKGYLAATMDYPIIAKKSTAWSKAGWITMGAINSPGQALSPMEISTCNTKEERDFRSNHAPSFTFHGDVAQVRKSKVMPFSL